LCTGFWWGKLKEREHLEELCFVGMIILKMVLQESECMGIDWIRLDEVPNMVM